MELPREGVVHIWSVPLNPESQIVGNLRKLLSADEILRADRFRFDRHRRRFTVGRGALRSILASYLRRDPAELQFDYGPKGKPSLAGPCGGDKLRFNLSHSSDLALYAVAQRQDLGVDVEKLRPMPDAEQIAERFFSESERVALRAIPGELKDGAFFNCWTRKEAYIKATGDGLSMPLDRFDVTLTPGEAAQMLRAEDGLEAAQRWTLVHLEPAAGYVGALAIEGKGWKLQTKDWEF